MKRVAEMRPENETLKDVLKLVVSARRRVAVSYVGAAVQDKGSAPL
jgi:hypothetical protein